MPDTLVTDAAPGRPDRYFGTDPAKGPVITQAIRAALDAAYADWVARQNPKPTKPAIQTPDPTPTPIPTPIPTPTPVLAPLQVIEPKGPRPFRTPPYIIGAQKVTQKWFRGWSTNIVTDGKDQIIFEDGITSDAYADDGMGMEGQGYYGWGAAPVIFRNWAFLNNGWQPGKPARRKTILNHNAYVGDKAGPALFEDCVFAFGAHAGGQPRSPANTVFRRCVFIHNGTNVLSVTGDNLLEDCYLLGGSYTAEPMDDKGNWIWTHNVSLAAYTTTRMLRSWIVGLSDMLNLPSNDGTVLAPRVKPTAIWVDKGHDHNPTGVGKVIASKSGVACYPGALKMMQAGSIEGDLVNAPAAPLVYDYASVLAKIRARQITAADASAKIRNDVYAQISRLASTPMV